MRRHPLFPTRALLDAHRATVARFTGITLALLSLHSPIRACGFDDPASVALGALNFAYPNALYVGTAVWQARQAGLLPAIPPDRDRGIDPARADNDPARAGQAALWDAMLTLDQLRKRLPASLPAETPSLAIVFTPAVMWSRLYPTEVGLRLTTHVAGPQPDDVVMITEPVVMQAWLNGKITADQLFRHELVRLYGAESAQAALRAAMLAVRAPQATPSYP